jgi:outer membrane receptor protein involved in Fe transport
MSANSIVRITQLIVVRLWGFSMFRSVRNERLLGSSAFAILVSISAVSAQEPGAQLPAPPATAPQTAPPPAGEPPAAASQIPQINVTAPKQTPKRAAAPKPATRPVARSSTPTQTAEQAAAAQTREVVQRTQTLDQRRDSINPRTGTTATEKTQQDIENLPQGSNAQLSDILYQFPGVSQDSTSSGDFHVRNEHGNVQYRINGILLPDGVSGFGQFLEPGFLKSMTLITGALPAQYGLHTSGIIDLTTKSGAALEGGNVGVYGGSRQTITPYFEYGGVTGKTDYFFSGRYLSTGLGLENPTNAANAIHDHTEFGRFFGYTSTLLDESTRLTTISGMAVQKYQIPANPGQPLVNDPVQGAFPGFTAFGLGDFSSANINQNQYEKNAYGVVAWQRSVDNVDVQLSYYSRYNSVHFVPDLVGDMLFNGTASDVFRSSFVNGIQGDAAYRVNDAHTVRTGFFAHGEQTEIRTTATVEALDAGGNAIEPPFNIFDGSNKFGWQMGAYVQDEWRITEALTLNTGVRFDQMLQYVDANQFSPRINATYRPWWATTFHAGYARYFTPPPQSLGRVFQAQLFDNTTNAAAALNSGSIQPERSDVYDVGVVQQLLPPCPTGTGGMFSKAPIAATNCPALEVGVSAYYKYARNLLDDGQFGAAYVLTAFNYDKGINEGVEFKAKFTMGNFSAYTYWSIAQQKATTVVSNQSLFGQDELDYISSHWISTDHSQVVSGSAGISYLWDGTHNPWIDGTKISASMIYGSGLRSGFANTDHLPAYGQVNLGLSKEFKGWGWDSKPVTVRFDVVNLLDTIYEIRDGSGIGVFAPQFGPRRGYYMGISQKL